MKGISKKGGKKKSNNSNAAGGGGGHDNAAKSHGGAHAGKSHPDARRNQQQPKQKNQQRGGQQQQQHQQQNQQQQQQHLPLNPRSRDPKDVAALKTYAAQRNRKGGRGYLLRGSGAASGGDPSMPYHRQAHGDALLDSFKSRLSGSTFRLMNEQLYTTPSDFACQLLRNEEAYAEYHDGYNRQLELWPVQPVSIVLEALRFSKKGRWDTAYHNMEQTKQHQEYNKQQEQQQQQQQQQQEEDGAKKKSSSKAAAAAAAASSAQQQQTATKGIAPSTVIADFGCGSAGLAKGLLERGHPRANIHSLDLCSTAEPDLITASDMAHTPLADDSVDIAVFSLSLMSTNWLDYLKEAHRVLKKKKKNTGNNNNNNEKSSSGGGGLLKVLEVRSRLPDPDQFSYLVESAGFHFVWGDVVGEGYFCAFDFEAVELPTRIDMAYERSLPHPSEVLTPCMYKRR